jgi:hypothetical protein
MRRFWLLGAAILCFSGCGYIGEPLPPALHIPERVTDLRAIQKGARIRVEFTLPSHTTEHLKIETSPDIELRIGTASSPPRLEDWEEQARVFTDIPADEATVKFDAPSAEWIGKDVVIGVKVFGGKHRTAGWSNLVTLSIVQPLAPMSSLKAESVVEGIRLTWQGSAPHYRIYRRTGEEKQPSAIHEADHSGYIDTTSEYDKTYHYSVEGFRSGGQVHAESDRTEEVDITPVDTFAPPVPTGLVAIRSAGSIELAWERSMAPDLAGYRIYRTKGTGAFEKLAETRGGPSYSDGKIEPGETYCYAVTAFDQLGNESARSAPVSLQVE